MIVRTFTSAWNLRTKIYAFDDVRLPMKGGITVPQLVAGFVSAIVWIPLMFILGVPGFMPHPGFTLVVLITPPILVLLNADTPIKHEKTLEEWLASLAVRGAEPKRLAAMSAMSSDRSVILHASRWVSLKAPDFGRSPQEVGLR